MKMFSTIYFFISFLFFFITQAYAQSPLALAKVVDAENPKISSAELTGEEKRWLAAHPTITIAFDGNYPPYSFKNEQGEFVGIAVDIADKLADKAGITFSVYPNGQWKNLYSAAQAGKIDIIATLVKQEGREDWFEFTRPYLSLSQYIITRQENLEHITSVESLACQTVALIEGYSTTELILKEFPCIKPYYVESLSESLEAVSTGLAEAAVGDIGMANHLISKSGFTNLGFAALYTKKESKQRFGVRKDWSELATILDKLMGTLTYQDLINIYAHWRVPEVVKPEAGFISVSGELTLEEKKWLKEHPVIRLASDFAWPPFESIDKNGRYSGIAAEYMQLIEQRLGIQFIRSPRKPWEDIVTLLKNKKLDVFSCAMETDLRRDYALFTDPYISQPIVIVTKDDVEYLDGLKGLYGKTIALEKGYASYDILSRSHPELKLQGYDNSVSALLAVSRDEAFAYIGNIASIGYILRDKGLVTLKISGQIPYQYTLSMGVRDDWKEFVPILQKALDSISLEEKNRILKNWIGVKVDDIFDYTVIWQLASVAAFIFLLFASWNYSLNRQIKKRTAELHHQANYDSLTGLPNRFMSLNTLSDLIAEALQNHSLVAVLLLDLDDFKKINDALGHTTGDQLLIEVAERLTEELNGTGLLGRLGGDEFIVCLGGLQTKKDSVASIERILHCFHQPFFLGERKLKVTASIGIATGPNGDDEISGLLRKADTAMYHAKKIGLNRYSFFNHAMKEKVARRLLIDECMHGALKNGEFEVHYQPKITVSTRKIMGFEALLRWNSPRLGAVPPNEFIPVAENNGLIVDLGKFVLEQALSCLAHWQNLRKISLNMAVNLSPVQFRDKGLGAYIAKTIAESGVSNDSLELEITEGVLMSGYTGIKELLTQFKDSGMHIAMDDFGTGYASLSYLRNYPFDILKIDREFISDITAGNSDSRLAQATIAIANSLGLKVVAEGVELEEQFDILFGYGCNYAQGFLFGKAVSADKVTGLLEDV